MNPMNVPDLEQPPRIELPMKRQLARRTFFRAAGMTLAGVGSLHLVPRLSAQPRLLATPASGTTPSQTAGPFYFNTALNRPDIAEGKPGIPMQVRLRVLSLATGQPVVGADVAIWHSTADGIYSGYAPNAFQSEETSGRNYCRGMQVTNASGRVSFNTVYPGWYVVRTPHIHVKVRVAGIEVLTTQLYFDETVNDEVFDLVAAYGGRGTRPVRNSNDGGFDPRLVMALSRHPGAIAGSFDICIA